MRIFNIDITRKGISPVVQVTEHDAMSRFFTLILRNGNADYEPPENPSYSVWYKTKDSTGWYDTIEEPDNGTHPAVVASGNMFTIEIAEAATTSCGELALMITGDDGYQLTVTGIITQSADIPGYDSSEVENYYNVYITEMRENAARAENAAATAIEYGATVEVDETAQQLIITHTDNTEDVQTWVTEAEAWAVGQRDGVDVPSTDETYHNNAKYYAQAAAQSAASLTVDTELSSTSTNPVQNKVIDATVTELKNDLEAIEQPTRNLADLNTQLIIGKAWNGATNTERAIVNVPITPATQYTVSFDSTGFDAVTIFEKANAADTTTLYSTGISSPYSRTSNASANCLCIQFNKSTGITAADFANTNLQVEYGTQATPYIAPQSAKDVIIRNGAITYVTPEMYGAWGDGVHDDTTALQTALNSGKNVIANNKYLISNTLAMRPVYKTGQKFEFNQIINTANKPALSLNNRNGYINGFYIESVGAGISIGDAEVTYNWDIHISIITSTTANAIRMGGGGNVSEVTVRGERFNYWTSGVYFNLSVGFVGQITFIGMTFDTDNPSGGYAFAANGATYPMTGLTCFNVSLEGANGGFEFANSQISTPISPLYCFGLRTSELTVVRSKKLLRLTGNGIIAGDIYGDIIALDSIDVSQHNPDITLEQSLNCHGRITGYGRGWRNIRIIGNKVVPTWNEEYMTNVQNPVYDNTNLPYSHNLISGAGEWTVTFPFDGIVSFISSADGTTLNINGTTVTLNNTQTCTVETVCSQNDVKLLIHRPNGTTLPKTLA